MGIETKVLLETYFGPKRNFQIPRMNDMREKDEFDVYNFQF